MLLDGQPFYAERYYADAALEPVDTCDFSEQAQVMFSLREMVAVMLDKGPRRSALSRMLAVADDCFGRSDSPAQGPSVCPALPSFGNSSMLSSLAGFLGQFD
jgi:hypothetical protein